MDKLLPGMGGAVSRIVELLRLINTAAASRGFTPLGSLPAFCFLPLVELPAVGGMRPGRRCVSPGLATRLLPVAFPGFREVQSRFTPLWGCTAGGPDLNGNGFRL
jgi:hypothetical protein